MVINEFRRSTKIILFVVGDEGISLKAVCEIMDTSKWQRALKSKEDL